MLDEFQVDGFLFDGLQVDGFMFDGFQLDISSLIFPVWYLLLLNQQAWTPGIYSQ